MDDRMLAALLEDAVSDVEPTDRLGVLRAEVAPSRAGWYAGGALVAMAATVTAIAVLGGGSPERALDPAASPTPTPSRTQEPSSDESTSSQPALPATLFWVGDGGLLYTEVSRVDVAYGESLLSAAIRTVIQGAPDDPDYRSAWPRAEVIAVEDLGSSVQVTTTLDGHAVSFLSFPAALQVANTAWAVKGERVEIQFVSNDPSFTSVYRFGPLESEDLAVQSPIQLHTPAEGQQVSGSFTASGMASSYEATIPWRVEDARGRVVLEGFATAEGWMDRLYPWETEVDVSGLAPGTYTFVASTADPSGGEGPGPTLDTRTVHVR